MMCRGHLQQLSRTAAMERARCERRHRHLEQWLARGMLGRHSERAPPGMSSAALAHSTGSLTRSKSLELLDECVQRTGLPPCKSLDELEAGVEQVKKLPSCYFISNLHTSLSILYFIISASLTL